MKFSNTTFFLHIAAMLVMAYLVYVTCFHFDVPAPAAGLVAAAAIVVATKFAVKKGYFYKKEGGCGNR